MTVDQIVALIGAVGGVLTMLHLLTALDWVSKIELGGTFAAAAAPVFVSSHNYVLAASAGVAAIGMMMRQLYKAPPGTVAVPRQVVRIVPPKEPNVAKLDSSGRYHL